MDSPYATRARAARYIRGAFLFLRGYIRYDGVCVCHVCAFSVFQECVLLDAFLWDLYARRFCFFLFLSGGIVWGYRG